MRGLRAIESELIKFEAMTSLERAFENNFRRIVEAARDEWERRFAGNDPSDACVSVRIVADKATARVRTVRGPGFIKAGKRAQRRHKSKLGLPRFAR